MNFVPDSNNIQRATPSPIKDAGIAIDNNFGTISAAITSLNAAITTAQSLLTSLQSTVTGQGTSLTTHEADTAAHGATSANTLSHIVARDSSGKINVGAIDVGGGGITHIGSNDGSPDCQIVQSSYPYAGRFEFSQAGQGWVFGIGPRSGVDCITMHDDGSSIFYAPSFQKVSFFQSSPFQNLSYPGTSQGWNFVIANDSTPVMTFDTSNNVTVNGGSLNMSSGTISGIYSLANYNSSFGVDPFGDVNAASYSVGGTSGFTGTGNFTNFTIVGGIITAAS